MLDTKTKEVKKVFVSYLEDNGKIINGYFEVISETPRFKIRSGKNIITIPENRLLKVKESDND